MRIAFKYRIYPTKTQAIFLDGQLREACDLYNCALQERRGAWKTSRKSISFYEQDRQLKPMRADGCLVIANFNCARDVLRRVDRAFLNFFARVKNGEKTGYPRWKSSSRYSSLTFEYGDGSKLLCNRLRIQGAGSIRIKLHRDIAGTIKTVTVKKEAERWFASFSVEPEPNPLQESAEAVGIDFGLTSFAVLSDGSKIENPRCYQKSQKKLKRAQRKVNRRIKGSNRRRKAVLSLQRAHIKIRNQRSDFQHKASRKLVNSYGRIAVEDLNVKGLSAGILAKSVNDAGWSMFVSMLLYKAERAGREVALVDPRGTSQTCICGESVPKSLADRWHDCHACGLSAGRDHVSALVVLQRSAWNMPSGANVEVIDSCVA